MFSRFILSLLAVGFVSTRALPIKKARRTVSTEDASSPAYIPTSVLAMLLDVSPSSKGLFPVFSEARSLSRDKLLRSEYQSLERKVCVDRVFTHVPEQACNKGRDLTYAELIRYYNEFVLQLKLAEHNYHIAINAEINRESKDESLEREEKIIRLLNETILPALEFTLNISRTNCSITTLLSDWMISLYSNCISVQTSNKFLAKTARSLFILLDHKTARYYKSDRKAAIKSRKEWCIV